MKGGKVSFTAFEAHWLMTILDTINPIELDALLHVKMPLPQSVKDDPGAAWDKLVEKISAIEPELDD